MSDIVKVEINLKDGTFSVEAPSGCLEEVFSRLEKFIPTIIQANPGTAGYISQSDTPEHSEEIEKDNIQTAEKPKTKKKWDKQKTSREA